jgi:hypothetical protein
MMSNLGFPGSTPSHLPADPSGSVAGGSPNFEMAYAIAMRIVDDFAATCRYAVRLLEGGRSGEAEVIVVRSALREVLERWGEQ